MRPFIILFVILLSYPLQAQMFVKSSFNTHNLLADQTLSIRSGVENINSLHYGIARSEDRILPNKWLNEDRFIYKSVGILGRSVKYILLDLPLDYFSIVLLHEYFGHGSRYREFDMNNIDYGYDWPPPYGNGGGHATNEILRNDITLHELIPIWTGGFESQLLLHRQLNMQWINGDEIYYRDASLYFWSFQILMNYIVDSIEDLANNSDDNDPQAYVRLLNNNFGILNAEDFIYTMKNLKSHTQLNAINPFIYLSIYSLLKSYLWNGDTHSFSVPMLKVGNLKYLPSYRAGFTPFGVEHHFENYFQIHNKTALVDISMGDNTFYSSWGGFGILLKNIYSTTKLSTDLNINLWNQPVLQLDKNLFNDEIQFGTAISIRGYFNLQELSLPISFIVELGYKSAGYLEGYNLDASPIIMMGISFRN